MTKSICQIHHSPFTGVLWQTFWFKQVKKKLQEKGRVQCIQAKRYKSWRFWRLKSDGSCFHYHSVWTGWSCRSWRFLEIIWPCYWQWHTCSVQPQLLKSFCAFSQGGLKPYILQVMYKGVHLFIYLFSFTYLFFSFLFSKFKDLTPIISLQWVV